MNSPNLLQQFPARYSVWFILKLFVVSWFLTIQKVFQIYMEMLCILLLFVNFFCSYMCVFSLIFIFWFATLKKIKMSHCKKTIWIIIIFLHWNIATLKKMLIQRRSVVIFWFCFVSLKSNDHVSVTGFLEAWLSWN